jgi:hypothetical protein
MHPYVSVCAFLYPTILLSPFYLYIPHLSVHPSDPPYFFETKKKSKKASRNTKKSEPKKTQKSTKVAPKHQTNMYGFLERRKPEKSKKLIHGETKTKFL